MASDILLKIGSIVLLLGGLIFVHEFGHFLAAKALGVKVVEFSVGFGPKILGFRRGRRVPALILPLGGYVKMAGDQPRAEVSAEDRARGFLEHARGSASIAVAGPAANLAFPVIIYFALALAQTGSPVPGPVLGTIMPGSAAERAGLLARVRVLTVAVPGRPATPFPTSPTSTGVGPRAGERISPPWSAPARRSSSRWSPPPRRIEPRPRHWRSHRGEPRLPGGLVASSLPGVAGPLRPLRPGGPRRGASVRNIGDLDRILRAAPCAPLDLEVLRVSAVGAPSVSLSTYEPVRLGPVPTCVEGVPAFTAADPTVSTFIAEVTPDSPAARAGLRRGDAITSVNGKAVRSFRELNQLSPEFLSGTPVKLGLAGGRAAELVPADQEYVDEMTRETHKRVTLGFFPEQRGLVEARALVAEEVPLAVGVVEALSSSVGHLGEVVRLAALGIARIVQGEISFKTVGGPIMLFRIAAQAAQEGWSSFLFKMALISVNLGLMNLLPIPVLDGGHIVATAVEAVTRKPLSLRTREVANLVGILLLVSLMVFVFKNDIVRLMG